MNIQFSGWTAGWTPTSTLDYLDQPLGKFSAPRPTEFLSGLKGATCSESRNFFSKLWFFRKLDVGQWEREKCGRE